jgi:hypothetical protein
MGGIGVGGILAYAEGSFIKNSSFRGSINNDGGLQTGGIAGNIYSGSEVIDSNSQGTISGGYYVGGLVGVLNSGSLVRGSYFNGNIKGKDIVGGIAGASSSGTIKKSYSYGTIEGESYIGGIAGEVEHDTIENSYSNIKITSNGNYLGGIVGVVVNHDNSESTIKNSYSNTSIIHTGTDKSNIFGLRGGSKIGTHGANNSVIQTANSFYNKDLIPTPEGYNPDFGSAKTTSEIETFATYSLSWDIVEDDTLAKGTPILAWQKDRDDYVWLIGTNIKPDPEPKPDNSKPKDVEKVIENIEQITNSTTVTVNNYMVNSFDNPTNTQNSGSQNSNSENSNLNQNVETLALNSRVGGRDFKWWYKNA